MTNGVSGNSVYRFIKYLSESGNTAEQVFSGADTNDNGCTKTELKKYLENLDCDYLSGSDASKIFSTFNTNTSGKVDGTKVKNKNVLTEDEAAQAEEYVEKYEAVQALLDAVLSGGSSATVGSTTCSTNVEIPTDLMPYVSRSSLEESLMNSFDKNMDINNLDKILGKAIAKSGADGYSQACINDFISEHRNDLPSGYTVADDDLQGLIDSYIQSLDGTSLDYITDSIDAIVEAYFTTIGIGDDVDLTDVNGINLSRFGWNESRGLNDLQLKMITDAVSEKVNVSSLGIDLTNSKNKKLFEQAVSDFIKEQYSGQDDYNEIMDLVDALTAENFINSNAGQVFIIMTKYADFSVPAECDNDINSLYYNALVDAFGEDFASRLAEADSTYAEGELYNNILKQVANMLKNGEIEPDEVIDKIIELINQNIEQFGTDLGLSSSGLSVDASYNVFDNLVNNDNPQLSAVRTAAINFLDSASAIGNATLNAEIKAQFGDDYATTIQNLRVISAIKNKVNAVKDKYTELVNSGVIIDMNNLTVNSGYASSTSITAGRVSKFSDASINLTDSNGNRIASTNDHRITYSATSVGGYCTASINANTGKNLVIKAGNIPITDRVEIKVFVNGQEVGSHMISVEIKEQNDNISVAGTDCTLGNLLNKGTTKNDMVSKNIATGHGLRSTCEMAKSGITGSIDDLANAFRSAGYQSDIVDSVAATMKSYYVALLEEISQSHNSFFSSSGAESTTFTYHNDITGNDASVSSGVGYSLFHENNVEGVYDHSGYASSGIYVSGRAGGMTSIFVDMGTLAKKFASFLAQAENRMMPTPQLEAYNTVNKNLFKFSK